MFLTWHNQLAKANTHSSRDPKVNLNNVYILPFKPFGVQKEFL